MKKAFTMIEIVFSIVVIGIVASIALGKLAATRDDAKASADLSTISTRLASILNIYNAKGDFNLAMSETSHLESECYTFVDSRESGGIIYVNVRQKDGILPSFCDEVERGGTDRNLIGEHILRISGSLVSY
jgi:prepilin-type N-terminal cleavage/methylation domain-containing protein